MSLYENLGGTTKKKHGLSCNTRALVGATAPFSKPDGHPDAGNVTLFDALGELTDSVLLQAAAVHGKGPPHNLRPRKIPNRRSGLAVLQPGQHFIAASGLQETRVWRNESTLLASMMMDPRGWKMVQDSTTWCWSFDEDHPLKFIWTKTKTGPFTYVVPVIEQHGESRETREGLHMTAPMTLVLLRGNEIQVPKEGMVVVVATQICHLRLLARCLAGGR